ADPAEVTPEWIARFDAIFADAPASTFPALSTVGSEKVVTAEVPSNERNPVPDGVLAPLKEKLLTAAGAQRRAEWEQFLKGREAEERAANPNVANYERRPQPLTYQHPLSVEGSMARTQVAPD